MKNKNDILNSGDLNLFEAKFSEDGKSATVTLIQEGFSQNTTNGLQRYYTKEAVTDVAELINTRKKMYLNHFNGARMVQEWAATVIKGYVEEISGITKAKADIVFTDNPVTSWLHSEAKKHPEEVGLSIAGGGAMTEGKIGGRDAAIVNKVTVLASTDFVTEPAAGGQVDFAEAIEKENEYRDGVLKEELDSLKDRYKKSLERMMPQIEYSALMDTFYNMMYDVMYDKDVADEDIDKFFSEFDGLIKDCVKKGRKNLKESIMDLTTFKKENTEAYEQLEEQISILAEAKLEKKFSDKIDEMTKKIEKATETISDLTTKLEEATKKNEAYEQEVAKVKHEKFVTDMLAEKKIVDKVDDEFKQTLLEADEATVTKLVNQFSKLLENVKPDIKMGPSKPVDKTDDDTKVTSVDEAKAIVGLE